MLDEEIQVTRCHIQFCDLIFECFFKAKFHAEKLFRLIDIDGDGNLTQTEFLRASLDLIISDIFDELFDCRDVFKMKNCSRSWQKLFKAVNPLQHISQVIIRLIHVQCRKYNNKGCL